MNVKVLMHTRRFAAIIAIVLSSRASALEDIDLFTGASGSVMAPNVLFLLDNTSNWSANSNAWEKQEVYDKCSSTKYSAAEGAICRSYVERIFGTSTKLVQGQVEIRALKLVLNEAHCLQLDAAKKLSFNAGLMMLSDGTADSRSGTSGFIRHAIKPMSATQCSSSAPSGADLTQYLIADLDHIDARVTAPEFKIASSAEYGAALYEAFKYFGGYTNPANAPAASSGGGGGRTWNSIWPNRVWSPTL